MFLNGHAGSSEAIQTQLLQIRHLTSPKEDLCPAKLVLVGVLEIIDLQPNVQQMIMHVSRSALKDS